LPAGYILQDIATDCCRHSQSLVSDEHERQPQLTRVQPADIFGGGETVVTCCCTQQLNLFF